MIQKGSEFNINMFVMEKKPCDFKFWEEKLPSDAGMGEGPCQGDGDCRVRVCSPPFWRRKVVDLRRENSPLLPNKHSYSCPSPASRLRAIADGRRELMEMIKGMPESSYELSLKDMVVNDRKNVEEDVQEKEVIVGEDTEADRKMESRILHNKNMYSSKSSQISRTEGMDNEVFLLKMFLPTSLSLKKKPLARKLSKLSPGLSPEESEGTATKNWWKIAALAMKSNQNGAGINKSASDVSNNSISEDKDTFTPFRCSFKKKSKSGRRKGCLF